jgi:hypothetical protein
VSIKEQWGGLLGLAKRLEMAVAVTEMPGVGENTMPYNADSWRLYPALLDELAAVADSGPPTCCAQLSAATSRCGPPPTTGASAGSPRFGAPSPPSSRTRSGSPDCRRPRCGRWPT